MNPEISIVGYNDTYKQGLLSTWELAVLATHQFLAKEDFIAIKEILWQINFNELNVHCLMHQQKVVGFIGLADAKIEMLFVLPEYMGLGLGKRLIQFAIAQFNASKVDVNEQNENAVLFYKKMGFEVLERTNNDDQGRPYPLLRMKLKNPLQ